MKSVVLILDTDSALADEVHADGHYVLYANDSAQAMEWIKKQGSAISRALINPRCSHPAGIPLFRAILMVNPEASVWLIADDVEPWCISACRLLGYQGVITKNEPATEGSSWLSVADVSATRDEIVELTFDHEMLPVLPFQLEHSDPLRFSLFCKTSEGYIRIFQAKKQVSFSKLLRLSDPIFYVVKDQLAKLLRILDGFECHIQESPALAWQEHLAQFISGPFVGWRKAPTRPLGGPPASNPN